jgi:hypothetical protein
LYQTQIDHVSFDLIIVPQQAKSEGREIGRGTIGEIAKEAGAAWAKMDDAEKEVYTKKAEKRQTKKK